MHHKYKSVDVIRSLWVGGNILPTIPLMSINSFLMSGYRYEIFSYSPLANIPKNCINRDACDIMQFDPLFVVTKGTYGKLNHAVFADLFRYEMLYRLGGWWADTDVICLGQLSKEDFFLQPERDIFGRSRVNNCLIRMPPRSPLMEICLKKCRHINVSNMEWGDTGPRLITQATIDLNLDHLIAQEKLYNPVNFTEFHKLFEPGFVNSCWKIIHLWQSRWKEENIDQDGDFKSCLYSSIREKYK